MLMKRGDTITLQWNAIHGHYLCPNCQQWQDTIGWLYEDGRCSDLRETNESKAYISFPCGLTTIALKGEALNVYQRMIVKQPCRPNVFTMDERNFRKYVEILLGATI